MYTNIIQLKDWRSSPTVLKEFNRQIESLRDNLEELLDSKEESLDDLEEVLKWAVHKNFSIEDNTVQNSLKQFVDMISFDENVPKITSFETIINLVEALDEIIIEQIVCLTNKRLESLRLKWHLINDSLD